MLHDNCGLLDVKFNAENIIFGSQKFDNLLNELLLIGKQYKQAISNELILKGKQYDM